MGIFGQNLSIRLPGVTIYRVTPYCLTINFEEIPSCFVLKGSKLGSIVMILIFRVIFGHHALSRLYFCGYFALSNGPNWEVICIIQIFGVIFGQNLGI